MGPLRLRRIAAQALLELKRVQKGVFFAANRLYGLTFKERTDLPVYHPIVRVFDVFDANGKRWRSSSPTITRANKRGGAWMNEYVSQSGLTGYLPVVANHLNIPKPPAGQPTLLTWAEVTTAFHEFGHALHGMFSNVKYPYFSGHARAARLRRIPFAGERDVGELADVLKNYAKHYQTGAPIPQQLLDKVMAAAKFNQGFATTEYLGAAMLDQRGTSSGPTRCPRPTACWPSRRQRSRRMAWISRPCRRAIAPPTSATSWGGYSAGYYSYIWSEVLDATAEWFKAHGGLTRANGDRFRDTLLSRGGSEEAMKLFRNFTGREPDVEPTPANAGDRPCAGISSGLLSCTRRRSRSEPLRPRTRRRRELRRSFKATKPATTRLRPAKKSSRRSRPAQRPIPATTRRPTRRST